MSGLLCLKWNNHSSTFLKHLSKLRIKEHFCDATIVCHNKFFSVHKFVLSSCSEYFEEIFEKTLCKHPFIIVKDIQPSEIEALLDYMYEGEVNVLQELLPGIIKAAEYLRVKGLAIPDENKEDTFQSTSRKTKRDRTNAHKSRIPHKRSRHSDVSILERDEHLQIHESDILQPKEKNDKVGSINCEAEIQSEDSDSNFNSETNKSMLTNIKPEPDDNSEVIYEAKPVETACEYSFNNINSNLKDESLSQSASIEDFGLMGLSKTNSHDEPQCSSWEGLIQQTEGGCDSNTTLESFQDEIDTSYQPHLSYTQNINPLLNLAYEGLSMRLIPTMKSYAKGFKKEKKVSFQCSYCPYTSRNSANVKRHVMNRHTGDKPYKCTLCDYKSSQSDHIKKHMRVHTGEKPFVCPTCPFKAAQSSNVKRHIKTHLRMSKSPPISKISIESDGVTGNLHPIY